MNNSAAYSLCKNIGLGLGVVERFYSCVPRCSAPMMARDSNSGGETNTRRRTSRPPLQSRENLTSIHQAAPSSSAFASKNLTFPTSTPSITTTTIPCSANIVPNIATAAAAACGCSIPDGHFCDSGATAANSTTKGGGVRSSSRLAKANQRARGNISCSLGDFSKGKSLIFGGNLSSGVESSGVACAGGASKTSTSGSIGAIEERIRAKRSRTQTTRVSNGGNTNTDRSIMGTIRCIGGNMVIGEEAVSPSNQSESRSQNGIRMSDEWDRHPQKLEQQESRNDCERVRAEGSHVRSRLGNDSSSTLPANMSIELPTLFNRNVEKHPGLVNVSTARTLGSDHDQPMIEQQNRVLIQNQVRENVRNDRVKPSTRTQDVKCGSKSEKNDLTTLVPPWNSSGKAQGRQPLNNESATCVGSGRIMSTSATTDTSKVSAGHPDLSHNSSKNPPSVTSCTDSEQAPVGREREGSASSNFTSSSLLLNHMTSEVLQHPSIASVEQFLPGTRQQHAAKTTLDLTTSKKASNDSRSPSAATNCTTGSNCVRAGERTSAEGCSEAWSGSYSHDLNRVGAESGGSHGEYCNESGDGAEVRILGGKVGHGVGIDAALTSEGIRYKVDGEFGKRAAATDLAKNTFRGGEFGGRIHDCSRVCTAIKGSAEDVTSGSVKFSSLSHTAPGIKCAASERENSKKILRNTVKSAAISKTLTAGVPSAETAVLDQKSIGMGSSACRPFSFVPLQKSETQANMNSLTTQLVDEEINPLRRSPASAENNISTASAPETSPNTPESILDDIKGSDADLSGVALSRNCDENSSVSNSLPTTRSGRVIQPMVSLSHARRREDNNRSCDTSAKASSSSLPTTAAILSEASVAQVIKQRERGRQWSNACEKQGDDVAHLNTNMGVTVDHTPAEVESCNITNWSNGGQQVSLNPPTVVTKRVPTFFRQRESAESDTKDALEMSEEDTVVSGPEFQGKKNKEKRIPSLGSSKRHQLYEPSSEIQSKEVDERPLDTKMLEGVQSHIDVEGSRVEGVQKGDRDFSMTRTTVWQGVTHTLKSVPIKRDINSSTAASLANDEHNENLCLGGGECEGSVALSQPFFAPPTAQILHTTSDEEKNEPLRTLKSNGEKLRSQFQISSEAMVSARKVIRDEHEGSAASLGIAWPATSLPMTTFLAASSTSAVSSLETPFSATSTSASASVASSVEASSSILPSSSLAPISSVTSSSSVASSSSLVAAPSSLASSSMTAPSSLAAISSSSLAAISSSFAAPSSLFATSSSLSSAPSSSSLARAGSTTVSSASTSATSLSSITSSLATTSSATSSGASSPSLAAASSEEATKVPATGTVSVSSASQSAYKPITTVSEAVECFSTLAASLTSSSKVPRQQLDLLKAVVKKLNDVTAFSAFSTSLKMLNKEEAESKIKEVLISCLPGLGSRPDVKAATEILSKSVSKHLIEAAKTSQSNSRVPPTATSSIYNPSAMLHASLSQSLATASLQETSVPTTRESSEPSSTGRKILPSSVVDSSAEPSASSPPTSSSSSELLQPQLTLPQQPSQLSMSQVSMKQLPSISSNIPSEHLIPLPQSFSSSSSQSIPASTTTSSTSSSSTLSSSTLTSSVLSSSLSSVTSSSSSAASTAVSSGSATASAISTSAAASQASSAASTHTFSTTQSTSSQSSTSLFKLLKKDEELWAEWEGLKVLGEGVYGRVYLVKHRQTSEMRAFKRMYLMGQGTGLPSGVQREISMLQSLMGHENIIPLLGVYIGDRRLYLSFPVVHGGSLGELVRRHYHPCRIEDSLEMSEKSERTFVSESSSMSSKTEGEATGDGTKEKSSSSVRDSADLQISSSDRGDARTLATDEDRSVTQITSVKSGCSGGGSSKAGDSSVSDHSGMPLPMVRRVMKQLLSGLAHCHSKNILHRDLKPDNILCVVESQTLPHRREQNWGCGIKKRGEKQCDGVRSGGHKTVKENSSRRWERELKSDFQKTEMSGCTKSTDSDNRSSESSSSIILTALKKELEAKIRRKEGNDAAKEDKENELPASDESGIGADNRFQRSTQGRRGTGEKMEGLDSVVGLSANEEENNGEGRKIGGRENCYTYNGKYKHDGGGYEDVVGQKLRGCEAEHKTLVSRQKTNDHKEINSEKCNIEALVDSRVSHETDSRKHQVMQREPRWAAPEIVERVRRRTMSTRSMTKSIKTKMSMPGEDRQPENVTETRLQANDAMTITSGSEDELESDKTINKAYLSKVKSKKEQDRGSITPPEEKDVADRMAEHASDNIMTTVTTRDTTASHDSSPSLSEKDDDEFDPAGEWPSSMDEKPPSHLNESMSFDEDSDSHSDASGDSDLECIVDWVPPEEADQPFYDQDSDELGSGKVRRNEGIKSSSDPPSKFCASVAVNEKRSPAGNPTLIPRVLRRIMIADFGLARCVRWVEQDYKAMILPSAPGSSSFISPRNKSPSTDHHEGDRGPTSELKGCRDKGSLRENSRIKRDLRSSKPPLSPEVITLNYRPLELLFGMGNYTAAVDVWSAGCIFFELLIGKELFESVSEFALMTEIFQCFGAPTEKEWPQLYQLPFVRPVLPQLKPVFDESLECKLTQADRYDALYDSECMDVIRRLLELNPDKRISAAEALKHPFFNQKRRKRLKELNPNAGSQFFRRRNDDEMDESADESAFLGADHINESDRADISIKAYQ